MSTIAHSTTTPGTFSERLRAASWGAHGSAQHSAFMGDLFAGSITGERYAGMLVQLRAIYEALDAGAAELRDDPVVGPFLDPRLSRVEAIEADLRHFAVERGETIPTLNAVATAYRARIEEAVKVWPGAYLAHHYVRYMGDLSGGQAISKPVERTFGPEAVHFYDFSAIADHDAFKQAYRDRLDATPWDDAQQTRFIDEVLAAYKFNTELLAAL